MVAIMAGGHHSPVSRIDNKLVVFALPTVASSSH
jgi:hypothetical protein